MQVTGFKAQDAAKDYFSIYRTSLNRVYSLRSLFHAWLSQADGFVSLALGGGASRGLCLSFTTSFVGTNQL